MVGNIIPSKGPDLFVKALESLDDVAAKGVIVGPEEPGYGSQGTILYY